MPRRIYEVDQTERQYVGESGLQGTYTLYLPLEARPLEAVVVYCPDSNDEARALEVVPRHIAAHGYAVAALSYTSQAWDHDVSDVAAVFTDAVDNLPIAPAVRPDVALVGHGRGGCAALRSAAQRSDVSAVVSLAAPVYVGHWLSSAKTFDEIVFEERKRILGQVDEDDQEYLRDLSPLFSAPDISAPTLLIHGTADEYCPLEQSVWMYRALGHSGNRRVSIELPVYVGHYFDHVFSGSEKGRIADRCRTWIDEALGYSA